MKQKIGASGQARGAQPPRPLLRDKDDQHAFRASELSGYVRPGKTTRLVVTIRRLEAQHELRVSQLEDWLTSGARSPREQVLKCRLRTLLGLK